MAKQNAYKSLSPVEPDRVRDELHKLRRLFETHERSAENLCEQAGEEKKKADECENRLFELLRADEKDDPIYELKSGILTCERPDAQSELPGTAQE
ncbi:MAG TPA: hypothetical protein VFY93_10450 [Planctomycetota bacterium]|nr:hypothetical protein [Planctomycetota bacterium]